MRRIYLIALAFAFVAPTIVAVAPAEAGYHSRGKMAKYARHKHRKYAAKRRTPRVLGFYQAAGGYAYGYEADPFQPFNGRYGPLPEVEDKTLWERVQTGPNPGMGPGGGF